MPPGHSRALNAGFDSSYSSRDIAIGFARVACKRGGAGAVQGLEATTGTPTQPPASPKIRWSNSRALKSVQTSSFFCGGGGFWRRFLVANAGDAGCVSVWRLLVRGAGSLRQRAGTAASAFASRSARGGEAGARNDTVCLRDAPNVKGLAIVGPRLIAGAGLACGATRRGDAAALAARRAVPAAPGTARAFAARRALSCARFCAAARSCCSSVDSRWGLAFRSANLGATGAVSELLRSAFFFSGGALGAMLRRRAAAAAAFARLRSGVGSAAGARAAGPQPRTTFAGAGVLDGGLGDAAAGTRRAVAAPQDVTTLRRAVVVVVVVGCATAGVGGTGGAGSAGSAAFVGGAGGGTSAVATCDAEAIDACG